LQCSENAPRAAPSFPDGEASVLRAVLAQLPGSSVSIFDHDLRILLAGGPGGAPFGLGREALEGEALEGEKLGESTAGESHKQLEQLYRLALSGTETSTEIRFGTAVCQVHVLPLTRRDGTVWAGLAVTRHVTDARMLDDAMQESERSHRLIAEHATEMFARLTPDAVYLWVSPASHILLGYSPEELVGRAATDFWIGDEVPSLHREGETEPAQTTVHRIRGADRTPRWVETTCKAVYDDRGHVREFITITRDVHERQTAMAHHEALLLAERQERQIAQAAVERLQAIQAVMDTALAKPDPDDFLKELLERIRWVLRGDTATLLLTSPDGRWLKVRACDGLLEEIDEKVCIAIGDGVIGRVATTLAPVIVDDMASVEVGSLFMLAPVRSLIGTPLMVDGNVIGVLHVGSTRPGRFDQRDLQLLNVVAERAAAAIERGRLFEQVRASHEQLHVLSRRLHEVQETERRHIARELHDEIGQSLSAVNMALQLALGETEMTVLQRRLGDCVGMVETAIGQVREMAVNLRPPVLELLGLVAALREYADRQAGLGCFEAHVSADALTQPLPPALESACFRVVQEAVTNVGRHAHATSVEITLRVRSGLLHVVICDDGRGFEVEEAQRRAERGESLGLLGMKERVLLCGGSFKVVSRPGHGTQIRASFAMDGARADDESAALRGAEWATA